MICLSDFLNAGSLKDHIDLSHDILFYSIILRRDLEQIMEVYRILCVIPSVKEGKELVGDPVSSLITMLLTGGSYSGGLTQVTFITIEIPLFI